MSVTRMKRWHIIAAFVIGLFTVWQLIKPAVFTALDIASITALHAERAHADSIKDELHTDVHRLERKLDRITCAVVNNKDDATRDLCLKFGEDR
jgi:hypothetical protein